MSKARQLADLGNVYDDGALSNRNLIINGAMQVAQRGTSFGVLASRAYTIDRWNVDAGVNAQRADLSVDEISEDTRLKYALQLLGNTSSQYFRQPIEDVTQFSSITCTLSFWVKGSSATTLNNIYARQAFGSGGSSVVDTAFSPVSHSVTTSYTKYTGTVTLPSISGKTLGSGHYLELFMQVPNGVTIYITGVQLEVGDTATPFEHRSYGDELAKCQRYYEQFTTSSGELNYTYGQAFNATAGETAILYTHKRAAPTITKTGDMKVWYGASSTGNVTISYIEIQNTHATVSYSGATGGSPSDAIQIYTGSSTATTKVDAEL